VYKQNRLVRGLVRLRGARVDLQRIEQSLLIVTADPDHIVPRPNTLPLLDLVQSSDVTHLAKSGGHIGLMAGSKARREIWPELAQWLSARSGERRLSVAPYPTSQAA
jgi:polyhydroxyalkanoate synthase